MAQGDQGGPVSIPSVEGPVLEGPVASSSGGGFRVLGGGTVAEMTVATPVCVDGRIFLRTHDSIWCIAAQ